MILSLGFLASLQAQSPHGAGLKIDCASCHTSAGWEIDASNWQNNRGAKSRNDTLVFNHNKTDFELTGRHATVDCRGCHENLVFSDAQSDCITCHNDVHQQTVGSDCVRCHTTAHWLVDNITALHQENGFPLLGQHAAADCIDCHHAETLLRFDRIGNDCVNCHMDQYLSTTAPDHKAAGYATACQQCHDLAGDGWLWSSGGANHLFFPLTKGHQIEDCTKCHIGGNFTNVSADCFSCHATDYQASTNPNHVAANFPTDCTACHSTDSGWAANDFKQHDQQYFPIFSGKHEGEWDQCIDCHTVVGNFKEFSCVDCHEHNNASDLADEHRDVSGYQYISKACYSCHPNGGG